MALIPSQDEEIGGFMIQQNVAGRPVTVFRFPPRTRLKALSHATVSIAIRVWVSSHCFRLRRTSQFDTPHYCLINQDVLALP